MFSIIQIGAGAGECLPEWLESDAQRIVLVEPAPTLAETLRQETFHDSRVHVVELAVSSEPGPCELLEYNLPQASGLHEPTGLKPLFPGLKLLHRHKITAVSAKQLMQDHGPAENETVQLVIHAPGEEHNIVQALVASDQLQQVSHISITASAELCCPGAVPIEHTLGALQEYGYHLQQSNDQDPDWPCWELHQDVQQQRIKRLVAEREALVEESARLKKQQQQLLEKNDGLQNENVASQQKLEQAHTQQQDLQAKLAERDQQLKDAQQHSDGIQKKLDDTHSWFMKRKQQAETLVEKLQEVEAGRDQQLKDSQQQSSAKQKKLDQAGTELADVQQQLEQASVQQQDLQAKLSERDQQLKDAQQQSSAKQKKLDQAGTELADVQQQLEQASAQQQDLQTKLSERDQQLKDAQQHTDDVQNKLDDTYTWFTNRKQQALEQAEALKVLESERDELQRQLAAQQQNDEASQSRFATLESKLEQLFGDQRTYIQQTTSALGQHVTRSAREQRDEQALAGYLTEGKLPITTRLPAAYGIELVKQYHEGQHDVVLVFGSSEATRLLAQAVYTRNSQSGPRLTGRADEASKASTSQRVAPANEDLPQAIISLEHRKADVEALKQSLESQGHGKAVSVVHAPWVECRYQGESRLYYACTENLQQLNRWLKSEARILVVVGNALISAGHSRIPALFELLQYLPTQQLDVVVEGTEDIQDLKAAWDALLQERERSASWCDSPGASILSIDS